MDAALGPRRCTANAGGRICQDQKRRCAVTGGQCESSPADDSPPLCHGARSSPKSLAQPPRPETPPPPPPPRRRRPNVVKTLTLECQKPQENDIFTLLTSELGLARSVSEERGTSLTLRVSIVKSGIRARS